MNAIHHVDRNEDGFMKKKKERRIRFLAVFAAVSMTFASIVPVYAVEKQPDVPAETGTMAATELDQAVNKFMSAVDKTASYNTVKGIYDKLKVDLTFDAAGSADVLTLLNGGVAASSEGYARTFNQLCAAANIPCLLVKGTDSWWNLVQLDQKWYGVDAALDDQFMTSDYFLVGSGTLVGEKTFTQSHVGAVQGTETTVTLSELKYGEVVVKDVIITPTVLTKVYGDGEPVLAYTCSESGLELTGSLGRTAGEAVGSYAINIGTLALKDTTKAAAYKLVLAGSPQFTVTQRPLTVTDVTLKTESRPYNGSALVELTGVTLGNMINMDDVAADLTNVQAVVSSAKAGTYTEMLVSGLTLTGAAAGNYSISESKVNKSFAITAPEGDGTEETPELEGVGSGNNAVGSSGTGASVGGTPSGNTQTGENTGSTQTGESAGNAQNNQVDKITSSAKIVLTVAVAPVTIQYGDALPDAYEYKLLQDGTEISAELADQINVVIGIDGDGKSVGTYPFVVSGENENYTLALDTVSPSLLTVEQKKVAVQFELPDGAVLSDGTVSVSYSGAPISLKAYYMDVSGAKVDATVVYDEGSIVPSAIGTYQISAAISDTNYLVDSQQVIALSITKKNVNAKNLMRTVTVGDTAVHSISLSEFGVPADAMGSVYVYNLVYSDDTVILSAQPSLKDNTLHFQLLENAAAGKSVEILLRTLPNHMIYNETEFSITVTVEKMGYTSALTGAPAKVTLGKDIALSDSFKLVTVYDNGERVEEIITASMLSGYDKNSTGTDSIGQKTVTVTSQKVEGASDAFVITVEDEIVGLDVTAPDQLNYYRGSSSFDLNGGYVALEMRSGISQSEVALTRSMLDVNTSIFNKVGRYSVDVKYKNQVKKDAFVFEVISSTSQLNGERYDADRVPDKGDFGVKLTSNDIKDGDWYDIEDISLVVSSHLDWDDENALVDYIERHDWDGYELFEIALEDTDDNPVELKREVTLYLPYPDGVNRSDCVIGVYHKPGNAVRSEKVTLSGSHIRVNVSELSPFAIVWRDRYSSSDDDDDYDNNYDSALEAALKNQKKMKAFWADVVEELEDTRAGKTVTVDAGEYDYIPISVLKAIKGRNVTLKIKNDTTKTIVLNGLRLPTSSSLRSSYTMKELYKEVNGSSASSGTSSSSGDSKLSSLEELWSSVVKLLKSYSSGTTVTINAKNNTKLPVAVFDAICGRNITIKLKSNDFSVMTFNGNELPVTLEKKNSYTLEELYDAITAPSTDQLKDQWDDVIRSLKKTEAGKVVTINMKASEFMPEAVLTEIRGRNVTVKLKSDYYNGTVSVNGLTMPSSLSGQKSYSVAQLKNRAQQISSALSEGNPTTGLNPIDDSIGVVSSAQSSSAAVQKPVEQITQSSPSGSSSAMIAPPIMELPEEPTLPSIESSVPAIEETEEMNGTGILLAITAGAVVVLLMVMTILLSGRKRRHRFK